MTRIIALNVPKVKPARRTVRKPGRFGAGLLASRPSYRAPFTVSDAAWLVAERAAAEDRHYDDLAEEAANQDRLDRGICL